MSDRRTARALRHIGFGAGASRLARPPSVLEEPDIRPGRATVIELVGVVTPNATTTAITFDGSDWTGTLLLAFLNNYPTGSLGTFNPPSESGWTMVGDHFAQGMAIWAKVADGSETSLTFNHGLLRQTTLAIISFTAPGVDGADVVTTGGGTLGNITASGAVNHRVDFLYGSFAPGAAPSHGSPAEMYVSNAGRSGERANAVYVVPLGPQPPSTVVGGLNYTADQGAISLLVKA